MEEQYISAEDMRYSLRAVALESPSTVTKESVERVNTIAERYGGIETLAEIIRRMLKSRAKAKRYTIEQCLFFEHIVTVLRAQGHDLYKGRVFK